MVHDKCEANGVLVEHLRQLALTPNQFQHHARASLRVLNRHRRRHRCTLASAAKEQEAKSVPLCGSPAMERVLSDKPFATPAPLPQGGSGAGTEGTDRTPGVAIKEALSAPMLVRRRESTPLSQVASVPSLGVQRASHSWPGEVKDLLATAPHCVAQPLSGAAPAHSGLSLFWGSCKIPHPRKAESGGEDSFFISPSGRAAGVADGVGEWEWRFGLNPRAFADELMGAAGEMAERLGGDPSFGCGADIATTALAAGFRATRSFGSATSLVMSLGPNGDEIGVASLGDSGLRQIRRPIQGPGNHLADMETRIVNRTNEQQHHFNCPYQLARLPTVDDFPRLQAEGKKALVRAVKSSADSKRDTPDDADLYTFSIQEGDLVVLGTDGVFDNLSDRELCELVALAVSPYEAGLALDAKTGSLQGEGVATDPMRLAEAVAKAAFLRSTDVSASKTPFSINAKQAGFQHCGGKMDDITLVVGWVVRAAE